MTDLSLRLAHNHIVGFVMRRVISYYESLPLKVDENAQILRPAQVAKRERDTKDSIKYKGAQADSQADSSFPADGHEAIPKKSNVIMSMHLQNFVKFHQFILKIL